MMIPSIWRTLRRTALPALLALFAAVALPTMPALALDLDQARAQGLIGERPNGYVGKVRGGGDVDSLVATVNAQRRQAYQRIASSRGTSLAAVESLAGRKLIAQVPAGQFFLGSGGWQRK